jgi:ATP-dependent RNA helicase DHX8/PRP22
MASADLPEMVRLNFARALLQLKAARVHDVLAFPLVDRPAPTAVATAMRQLHCLGALDADGALTDVGAQMARLPLDPPLARAALAAVELRCVDEAATVIALLSVENVFARPARAREQQTADRARAALYTAAECAHGTGDHLALLTLFDAWQQAGCSRQWYVCARAWVVYRHCMCVCARARAYVCAHRCEERFVSHRALVEARDVRRQLIDILSALPAPRDTAGARM